jgi:glycosyltransferase involved in cell wall biosynthesis
VDQGSPTLADSSALPVSVVIATKNEAKNLQRCLESVRNFGEVVVIDSQSSDATVDIARGHAADVVQFYYGGGWPKKRQWGLDNLPLRYEWILLLDADESVTPELIAEIRLAMTEREVDGYYIGLDLFFLGKRLRHCGASFYKLCLFRRGMGRFECRTADQDSSMCDMEVHEHVVVSGATRRLKHRLLHHNVDNLARYIDKHNQYSNWEAQVWSKSDEGGPPALPPALLGSQAQRRRWLKKRFLRWPGSLALLFAYRYFCRAGFLDGKPGLIYCAFQAIQLFHVKAKLYEAEHLPSMCGSAMAEPTLERESHVRN